MNGTYITAGGQSEHQMVKVIPARDDISLVGRPQKRMGIRVTHDASWSRIVRRGKVLYEFRLSVSIYVRSEARYGLLRVGQSLRGETEAFGELIARYGGLW